jgi:hypothetical protein
MDAADGGQRQPAVAQVDGLGPGRVPDGPKLQSILTDPRDPAHLTFALSDGGVHEPLDAGRNWAALVQGMAVAEGMDAADLSLHDPHCVRLCPGNPDRLYQQNHARLSSGMDSVIAISLRSCWRWVGAEQGASRPGRRHGRRADHASAGGGRP